MSLIVVQKWNRSCNPIFWLLQEGRWVLSSVDNNESAFKLFIWSLFVVFLALLVMETKKIYLSSHKLKKKMDDSGFWYLWLCIVLTGSINQKHGFQQSKKTKK